MGIAKRKLLADRHDAVGPVPLGAPQEHLSAQVASDGRRAPERLQQITAATTQFEQPGFPSHETVDQAAVGPFARLIRPRVVPCGNLLVMGHNLGLL